MPSLHPRRFDKNHLNTRLGLGVIMGVAVLGLLIVLKLLLPWLVLVAMGWAAWYFWQRYQQRQQQLYQCFYACLEQHGGCISVLDFAIAAHITGPQARAFLDARAQDFFAEFEPTSYGDVLYTFSAFKSPRSRGF